MFGRSSLAEMFPGLVESVADRIRRRCREGRAYVTLRDGRIHKVVSIDNLDLLTLGDGSEARLDEVSGLSSKEEAFA